VYRYRESSSPLVSIVWRSTAEADGTYVDAANEYWGLAFGTGRDSAFEAVLIGPSLTTRELRVRAGDDNWGVEFRAHVFLRRVPKLEVLGEIRSLPTDGHFFELAGIRFPVPSYESIEDLVEAMVTQGLLVGSPELARALAGDDPGYSERQLQRRFNAEVGLGRKRVAQLQRARRAYALMQAGRSLAEAAAEAGYADQAHLTRSFRLFAGRTPADILGDDADEFASRPARS
jgi:AraC-like DNA-binding protein